MTTAERDRTVDATLQRADAHTPETPEAKPLWRRLLPLGVIALGLALFFALGGPGYINIDALRDNRDVLAAFVSDNFVVAIIGFIAIYATLTAISFPGAWVLSVVGGFLFGTWVGGFAIVTGATIGAVALFLAARSAFGDVLRRRFDGELLRKFQKGLQDNELSYLFILRLVPLFPFLLVNIAPALFDVKLRNYIIATFFGIIPGALVYASVGNGIGAVFDRGEDANLSGLMFQPSVILPIIGLIALALVPVIYKRVKS